jgi:hypothetical protein
MRPNTEGQLNSEHENASELLWKYIEELKRADDSESVNFVVRTPADPAEFATLMPLADAVQESLRAETEGADGRDRARARLVEAIRAERHPAPRQEASSAGGWLQRLWHPKNRLLVVCGLLLLLAAAALGYVEWQAYLAACHPVMPH